MTIRRPRGRGPCLHSGRRPLCRFETFPNTIKGRAAFDYGWCKLCRSYFWEPDGAIALTIREVQAAILAGNIDESFYPQIRMVEIYPTATLHERTMLQLDRLLRG